MSKSRSEDTESKVVDSFGEEWNRFNQRHGISQDELSNYFFKYFHKVLSTYPLDNRTKICDYGAGSGRWADYFVRGSHDVTLVEPSNCVAVLKERFRGYNRTKVIQTTILDHYRPGYYDFSYCLGVLHHTFSVEESLRRIVQNSKVGGVVLIYVYQSISPRRYPHKFLVLTLVSLVRTYVADMPPSLKFRVCDIIALCVYLPLSLCHKFFRFFGLFKFSNYILPLGFYVDSSFYTMRTDSLDRFGTRIEARFSRDEVRALMEHAGLGEVTFNNGDPYWVAFGVRQ
jgi:2-polyprenyl-3-methyl-5-hydroxy-6-metoxy-1,4-benzoquinol methylase